MPSTVVSEAFATGRRRETPASTIAAYVEVHLRSAIAAVENLYNKYTVTLGSLLASRKESTEKLDGFLKELGYSLPEVN